ncbi:MAG: hypothetical protein DYG94_00965 [Leptolyngbya sp. PLA3]|nr:MAG: hypothetical protein EDM82_00910 [Cyanobacteria bacterium CYA]MCE7967303.1 hypothetical protein [Leptolyngbya sp. PL-A3]
MRGSGIASVAVLAAAAGTALAQPNINGAVINSRIFNDDSDSVFSSVNNYPAEITLSDAHVNGDGMGGEWANFHNWRLSADGGVSAAVFNNGDSFGLFADLTIGGPGNGEAGLSLAPWWSHDVDGRFNLRTTDGEIAIFGGRLPFYSFTGAYGLHYAAGTTVRIGMVYNANGLSAGDPATIEYFYNDGTQYSSGALNFDMGNPAEDPPYGLWGMLNDARVGGYMQVFIDQNNPDNGLSATWGHIDYIPAPGSLALLGLGALASRRRR